MFEANVPDRNVARLVDGRGVRLGRLTADFTDVFRWLKIRLSHAAHFRQGEEGPGSGLSALRLEYP
jgi:hypothetical protein